MELGKVRGYNVFLLTTKELYFRMWNPKKELIILVEFITEIKNPKSRIYRNLLIPF
ncbi:MAG: hypothetical protein ACFFA0_06745 [Promethearchaeota archaeon]